MHNIAHHVMNVNPETLFMSNYGIMTHLRTTALNKQYVAICNDLLLLILSHIASNGIS